MKIVPILALAALILISPYPRPPIYASPQTGKAGQSVGRIAGKIRPRRGIGFEVSLEVPGTGDIVAKTSADFVEHDGQFVLDGIRPGTYRLHVQSLPGLGCGIGDWSQVFTVQPGKTVHVTVRLRVARDAICQ